MPSPRDFASSDLKVGLTDEFEAEIGEREIRSFAEVSGDANPLHVDPSYAASTTFRKPIAHGAYQVGLASQMLGMRLPGKRVLLISIQSRFPSPLFYPARVKVKGEIASWNATTGSGQLRVTIDDLGSLKRTAEISLGFVLHTAQDGTGSISESQISTQATSLKRVLITGASGGLGRELARTLEQEYQVLAQSRSNAANAARAIVLDFREPSWESELSGQLGNSELYAIIHAAWPEPRRGGLLRSESAALRDEFLFGAEVPIGLAKLLAERAPKTGGRFIAIGSSYGGNRPQLSLASYSLGKAILERTITLLAPELARNQITANVVAPSFMPLGMNERVTERQRQIEEASVPFARLCSAADVASLVSYLLSDAASFISGQTLPLTGARL